MPPLLRQDALWLLIPLRPVGLHRGGCHQAHARAAPGADRRSACAATSAATAATSARVLPMTAQAQAMSSWQQRSRDGQAQAAGREPCLLHARTHVLRVCQGSHERIRGQGS